MQNIGILNARQINLVYISLSYSLRCETRHWSACDETSWLYIFLPKQLRESKYHTLVQCSLAMIIFNNALHASLTQHNSYMSFPNNHSVDSQFAIFISKGHIWPPKMTIYIYICWSSTPLIMYPITLHSYNCNTRIRVDIDHLENRRQSRSMITFIPMKYSTLNIFT